MRGFAQRLASRDPFGASPLSEKGEGGLVFSLSKKDTKFLELETSPPSPFSERGLGGEARRCTRYLTLVLAFLALTAQTPADSLRPAPVRTVLALPPDTARQRPAPAAAILPEAPDPVTRKLALRISGAILLLSLSTLLLYNVRSR